MKPWHAVLNLFFLYRIYFTPNRPLSGLALVGAVGTRGYLHVVADSQVMGQYVLLDIYFQLGNCPKGFYPPPAVTDIAMVSFKLKPFLI